MNKKSVPIVLAQILFTLFIVALIVITLYPFCWMFLNSFKSNAEVFQNPLSLPKKWNISIFLSAWNTYSIGTAFWNSLKITVAVVCINLFSSSMAAFATSHLNFKGKAIFLSFCIGCQVVSVQTLLTSLFSLLKDINMYNTHMGLILVLTAFSLPMSVYLFNGFFKGVPKDLYESAAIDACSNWQYYIKILLPLSKPIISTVIIFQAMNTWNEFLMSMTFLRDSKLWTIPPLLNNIFSGRSQNYGMQFAALAITVLPILLLYICLQKYFIKGLTAGAVKG